MQRQQFAKRRFVAKLAANHEHLLIDILHVSAHVLRTVSCGRRVKSSIDSFFFVFGWQLVELVLTRLQRGQRRFLRGAATGEKQGAAAAAPYRVGNDIAVMRITPPVFLAALEQGDQDIHSGRVVANEDARKKLESWTSS